MGKRAIIVSLLLLATLGFVACKVLPQEISETSVGLTALTDSGRTGDTGSVQKASGTESSFHTTAESPGETVDDPASGSAPGEPDTVDVPVFRDGSVEPANASNKSDKVDEIASGDVPGRPDKDAYWIDVDVTAQQVSIMRGEEVVKSMVCSTGVEGHETPLGTFEIQNRGEWFFNQKYQQGAKYWVSFKDWGIYLFHSLAMDRNQEVIPEEAAKLGEPASHGCIRLSIEDAKWIYDNIPAKTKVVIHE